MPRKKKVTINEEEILNRPVDTDGSDPNPAVNALMDEDFIKMSNFDASQIALVLQQIVRGQNSLLSLAQQNSEDIARLKEKQALIDKEAEARFASQRNEIEEILNKSEKLKATGEHKDKIIAQGVQQYQLAKQNARASKAVDKLAFEQKLAAEPQEYVVSPGQLITTMQGNQQVARIIPEELRIKHKVWYFQPGVPTKVPASVAATLRARRAGQEQTGALKEILGKHMEASKLAQKWNEHKGSGTMPSVPSS